MTPEEKPAPCQIQITPVDDGFVIQASSIDGFRKSAKQIADSIPTVRDKVHKLVDQLYEPVAKPTPVTKEPTLVGPAGTKSPS